MYCKIGILIIYGKYVQVNRSLKENILLASSIFHRGNDPMKVCHFGVSNPNYSRNRIIVQGLRQNGVEVIECNAYYISPYKPSLSPLRYPKKYIQLIKKHAKLSYDVLVTSYSGQLVMPLVKFITRKPVVLDAFLGWYEMVLDIEAESSNSWYYLDAFSLKSADLVLSDTIEHINYFHDQFGTDKTKFRRIFVGSDDKIFFPRSVNKEDDKFLVVFWGTFIPLQGVQYIVQAAKLLEDQNDVTFEILGYGKTFSSVRNLSKQLRSKNVSFFTKWVPYQELPNYVAKADVCLGIFGDTPKAKRVIPNKDFEALAMRKPLITGDSPAAREALTNMKNCILCEMANPKAIAESIMVLKDDEGLRKKIATNGYNLFQEKFTPKVIGKELKKYLNELLVK